MSNRWAPILSPAGSAPKEQVSVENSQGRENRLGAADIEAARGLDRQVSHLAVDRHQRKPLAAHPHAGFLELSRLTGVSRATLQARTNRLEAAGVITGYGPDVDLPIAGYPVLAFVNLQISQGNLVTVTRELLAIPEVLEAYGTTGDSDVMCKVAAQSHEALQQTLLRISSSASVVRSTSVVALSQIVAPRYLPLLEATERITPSRVPGLQRESAD